MPVELKRLAGTVPMHVLTEDAFRALSDGRQELIGRAGQQIPLAQAQALGLVGKGPEVAPSEAKAPKVPRKKADDPPPPADPT